MTPDDEPEREAMEEAFGCLLWLMTSLLLLTIYGCVK